MSFQNSVVGGVTLVRPAIQSPEYQTGVEGWTINQDGSAEFNDLTIRGTFRGTNFIQNADGLFFYSGTPANGNLIGSWASDSGTDEFGNTYPRGLSTGSDTTRQIVLDFSGTQAIIGFSVNNGNAATSGTLEENILNEGAANEYLSLQAQGPSVIGHTDRITLQLNSQNLNGSSEANAGFYHNTAGALLTVDPLEMGLGVPITTYANDEFEAWTPAISGGGTATFSTVDGYYQRIGKMVFVRAYFVVNAAGSGTSNVTFTLPVSAYRAGARQVLNGCARDGGVVGGPVGALMFAGGSGATVDRLVNSAGDDVKGSMLTAGSIWTFEGMIREE